METVLEVLLHNYLSNNLKVEVNSGLTLEIEKNKEWLKQNLSKRQKKLLLRIEDGKNLITEESNVANFITGFKLGLKIGYEVNKE